MITSGPSPAAEIGADGLLGLALWQVDRSCVDPPRAQPQDMRPHAGRRSGRSVSQTISIRNRLAHDDGAVPHGPKVRLARPQASRHADGVERHYWRMLLAAVALGALVAMLGVGRAQAAGPADRAWVPATSGTSQYQSSGRIDTSVDARTFRVDAF